MTSGHDEPLTRRQLRELERERAAAESGTESADDVVESAAPPPVESVAVDADETEPAAAESAGDSPEPEPPLTTRPHPDLPPENTLTRRELRLLVEQQSRESVNRGDEDEDEDEDEPGEDELDASEPVAGELRPIEPVPADLILGEPGSLDTLVVEAKDTVSPPPEHWVQADAEAAGIDIEEPFDAILARGITAAGPVTTTSALIMPEINSPRTGPVPVTGEILVTGSIDLPRSLGATGQHPNHFENADVDRQFDGQEESSQVADVAPVKASRAVSSHASARGVMAPPSKGGSTLPTALAVPAGVLALAVIGLFVAGVFFNAFSL